MITCVCIFSLHFLFFLKGALNETFTSLGFKVEIHNNLTAAAMKILVTEMGKRDFQNDDALVSRYTTPM